MLWIISLNCWNVFHQLHGHNTLDRKVHNSVLTFEYSVVCTVHCILNYLNTLCKCISLLVGLIAQDFHYKVSLILLSLGEKFPQYCEQVHYTVQHFNICISTEHTVLPYSEKISRPKKFCEWAIFPFSWIKISQLASKDPLA